MVEVKTIVQPWQNYGELQLKVVIDCFALSLGGKPPIALSEGKPHLKCLGLRGGGMMIKRSSSC